MPRRTVPADEQRGPDSPRAHILAEQVRLLYGNLNVGVGVTLVATTILGRLEWGRAPHPVILAGAHTCI